MSLKPSTFTDEEWVGRLWDVENVKQLMTRRCYYLYNDDRRGELSDLWVQKPEHRRTASYGSNWGYYVGMDSITNYYVTEHEKKQMAALEALGVEAAPENLGWGCSAFHETTTPMLYIAGDGKTARGLWYVPGQETIMQPDGTAKCYWTMDNMSADFVKEEDGWKLVGQNRMREGAQWPWDSTICTPEGMGITASKLNLEAGKAYPIVAHCRQCILDKDLQIRLAWRTPSFDTGNYRSAMDAVAKADTVIYFACDTVVGTGAKGGVHRDETDIGLSQEQTKLLLDTADAMKPEAKLIVVVQTANARAIGSWADRADAIVTTYMAGQEGSRVLAEILTGMTNPSGKLNQSWPARNEDTPLSDTPEHVAQRLVGVSDGDEVTLWMDEGIFTGYRWHDRYGVTPLFPFGHGLSYTRFAYSDVSVEAVDTDSDFGSTWTVRCKVTNTGEREGDEIVQLYLGRAEVPDSIQMAEKQLVGYVRLNSIAPGETKEAVMTIDPKMLCYWDPERPLQTRSDGTKDKWVRTSGQRAVYIGASSADIRLESAITV